jgi:hypothetical protein
MSVCVFSYIHIELTPLPPFRKTVNNVAWKWPLSGVHYIMMVDSSQSGKFGGGGGRVHALSLSLYIYTIMSIFVVYAPAERADTLLLLLLYPFLLCAQYDP